MKELMLSYIANYTDKSTRAFSFGVLMEHIDANRGAFEQGQVEAILEWTNKFSNQYRTAFPWKRSKIISQSIRELNLNSFQC
jgi:hypothetical protein